MAQKITPTLAKEFAAKTKKIKKLPAYKKPRT